MRYEIDPEGYFVCDDPLHQAPIWVAARPMQPCIAPRYVGGATNPATGERAGGAWAETGTPTVESQEQAAARLTKTIQIRLDEIAAERGYDSILSLCSYATSTVERFRLEGQAGVVLRDQCWQLGYSVLAEVEQGLRAMPTDEEALTMMPAMVWPEF